MPLIESRLARQGLCGTFAVLIFVQILYLDWMGNGLGKYSDGFSEANALRAAQAYLQDGLTSHHGLPRQLYGNKFPNDGVAIDHLDADGKIKLQFRQGFPPGQADPNNWVYTHYPPGPDYLDAMMGRFVGLQQIWVLRLFPLGLSLMASAVLFLTLARIFGADRAVVIAVACVILPMFNTHMPGLHYQGYSFALLLCQLSLLVWGLWGETKMRAWHLAVFFAFGFLQGWLSFDQFFVVCLAGWPLWLLRRTEPDAPSIRWLLLTIALPAIGFTLAHALHFLEVADELGGLNIALAEYRRTAGERSGHAELVLPHLLQALLGQTTSQLGTLGSIAMGCYFYVQAVLTFAPLQFFPWLVLFMLLTLPVIFSRPVWLTTRSQRDQEDNLSTPLLEEKSALARIWGRTFHEPGIRSHVPRISNFCI